MLQPRIKDKLKEAYLTQKDLANKLGVSQSKVNGWVTGRTKPPLETAFIIALLLRCNVDDLWTLDLSN